MNVYFKDGNVATKNLTPGISVYGEELIKEDEEYRIWNPKRSKLAAALLNGLENLEILDTSKVLYLGASTGTTVSHISDISPAFTSKAQYCSNFRRCNQTQRIFKSG